jgi:hypothetical protein
MPKLLDRALAFAPTLLLVIQQCIRAAAEHLTKQGALRLY